MSQISLGRRSLILGSSLLLAAALWLSVALWRAWPLGVFILLAVELPWRGGRRPSNRDVVRIVVGMATILALASYPVSVTARLVVAGCYMLWRWWLVADHKRPYAQAWVTQALVLEAIFVWAATTSGSRTIVVALVWLSSFAIARDLLASRSVPGQATILAATWALVAAEIGWVLAAWLVTYVAVGESLLIMQPALVISGVAYCFGSILAAQRQGVLSRSRLLEYVMVGILILVIVVIGTSWRAVI